jgi:DNA-binding IscR family transcriptional regulator
VKTIRGRKEGSLLNKPESEIKVNEIIEILENPIHVVNCVIILSLYKKSSLCSSRDIWTTPNNKVTETLFQHVLEDFVNTQNDKTGAEVRCTIFEGMRDSMQVNLPFLLLILIIISVGICRMPVHEPVFNGY